MIIRGTQMQLAERIKTREAGYLDSIRPALRFLDNGIIEIEAEHPAWVRAVERYRPLQHSKPAPIPHHAWPRVMKLIKRFARSGDYGIGDTVERLAQKLGADVVAKWLKKHGIDCGCPNRRKQWNANYPYESVLNMSSPDVAPGALNAPSGPELQK